VQASDNLKVPGFLALGTLTQAEIDALTPSNGVTVYNETNKQFEIYENGEWKPKLSVSSIPRDLYVSTTGDDVNGTGASGTPWATIDKALDFLTNFAILAEVTIHIDRGDYSGDTSDLVIKHPNGDKIVIQGASESDTVTFSSVSGSAGNYTYILSTANTSKYTYLNYVLVYKSAATGSNEERAFGVLQVVGINPGIAVHLKSINTSAASGGTFYISIPQVKWARLVKITHPLAGLKGVQNVYSLSSHLNILEVNQVLIGLVTLEDCLVVNTGSARYGFCRCLNGSSVYLRRVGLRNMNAGWYCYNNSSVTIEDGGATDCKYGLYIYTSSSCILFSDSPASSSPHFIYNQYGLYCLMESIIIKDGPTIVFSNNTSNSSPAQNSEGNFNSYMGY
jgi:hypothetical protein